MPEDCDDNDDFDDEDTVDSIVEKTGVPKEVIISPNRHDENNSIVATVEDEARDDEVTAANSHDKYDMVNAEMSADTFEELEEKGRPPSRLGINPRGETEECQLQIISPCHQGQSSNQKLHPLSPRRLLQKINIRQSLFDKSGRSDVVCENHPLRQGKFQRKNSPRKKGLFGRTSKYETTNYEKAMAIIEEAREILKREEEQHRRAAGSVSIDGNPPPCKYESALNLNGHHSSGRTRNTGFDDIIKDLFDLEEQLPESELSVVGHSDVHSTHSTLMNNAATQQESTLLLNPNGKHDDEDHDDDDDDEYGDSEYYYDDENEQYCQSDNRTMHDHHEQQQKQQQQRILSLLHADDDI
jgi:hypothetical protein